MAESSSVCDCYTSGQTRQGIHLSDAALKVPVGRVSIITILETGVQDVSILLPPTTKSFATFRKAISKASLKEIFIAFHDTSSNSFCYSMVILYFIGEFWFQKWRSRWAYVSYREQFLRRGSKPVDLRHVKEPCDLRGSRNRRPN
jgi:hypothetical protein